MISVGICNTLTTISLVTLCFASASLADEKLSSAEATYRIIESQVKNDWDRLANGKPLDADNAMPLVFYNRAVVIAMCTEEAPPEDGNLEKTRANQQCISAKLKEINDVMQLVSNTPPDKRERVSDCVTRGHDNKNELRFPPYEFLRNPSAQLFDFKMIHECILAMTH
ncbi:hypothetical protein [Bradyrhizobium sp. LTSP857]|uniref:hypothetical protein n=1 Tax=Bradyrhizobium sp. LTSP857 TaxID=1619231 RepID=UPI0005D1378A|nr:hypothetical protein [Bradyrhizobium sp. LTSP857]KJC44526.1 hypothetical protein UP06_18855 [Bradyrhizobium sp. LTSP857]